MTDTLDPVDPVEPSAALTPARPPMVHFKLSAIDSSLWTVSRAALVVSLFFLAQAFQGGIANLGQNNALTEVEAKILADLTAQQEEFARLDVATTNVFRL